MDLSITICSWNAKEDLQVCLQSLEAVRDEVAFEVIVVENNSEDGSGPMVATEFPWVTLLQKYENLGFCRGHNLAVESIQGRHWFCLNSDTIVHPGALRTLVETLDQDPKIAIVGPKLLNPDGSLQFSVRRFPNPLAALFRNTPFGKLWPNNPFTKEYLMKDFDHSQVTEADWVSGAAFVMSGHALAEIGKFDEEYVMFCEDVDLCFRAGQAGYKVVYQPTALVTHAIGRSTDKAPNRMIGRFHRSMFRFFMKNQLASYPWLLRPGMVVVAGSGLLARASVFILKNKVDQIRRRLGR